MGRAPSYDLAVSHRVEHDRPHPDDGAAPDHVRPTGVTLTDRRRRSDKGEILEFMLPLQSTRGANVTQSPITASCST
jgi:hypothetical protein